MGISAIGAEIGIPIILPQSHFVCIACLSLPPYFRKTSSTDSWLYTVAGYWTDTSSFPLSSSARLLSLKGGTLFKPHSWYGRRSNNLLPYDVTFVCQPFSYFSHFSQVVEALFVSLSMYVVSLDSC